MKENLTLQFLKDDHKRIRGLFRQLETAGTRAPEMKTGVYHQVVMELEIHLQLEETYLYEFSKNLIEDEMGKGLLFECEGEHRQIRSRLAPLKSVSPTGPSFDKQIFDLIVDIETHFSKEENELYPLIQKTIGDFISPLSTQMHEARERLLQLDQYKQSRSETVQNPHGGEQIRKKRSA